VATAADRDRQLVIAAEPERANDVVGVRAAGDQRGTPIDHAVPDRARVVVVGVTGANHAAGEGLLERAHVGIPYASRPRHEATVASRIRDVENASSCRSGVLMVSI
jgi:hypothetical protein